MKQTGALGLTVIAAIPLAVAMRVDDDLSSKVHVVVIGVSATAVALCDALFGQIVAMTGEMPFRNWKTPAEAKRNIKAFDAYHKSVFTAWAVAKVASSLAVMLPAITLAVGANVLGVISNMWLLAVGYLALGVSLAAALFFIVSYWNARSAANEFRLEEITQGYKDGHFRPQPLAEDDREAEEKQLEVMSGYDGPVTPLEAE